jgi:hypothetical protein
LTINKLLFNAKSKNHISADQEVVGKHLKSREWVMFSGKLTIYDRKINPIVIKLKNEIFDTFIGGFMEEKKEFKGNSVTEVYGKLSKWLNINGIIFQN